MKKIKNALISVYHKEGLDEIIRKLQELGVLMWSTGGTYEFISGLGVDATKVEDLTGYPSILGGRVKTLHPKVFGGILARSGTPEDHTQLLQYSIPEFDLVIVDLYPFEATVASGSTHEEIIEKIDIGGISLIRAAAKNFNDVLVVPCASLYPRLLTLLKEKKGKTEPNDRKYFATEAFNITSHYDTAIFNYFNSGNSIKAFKKSILRSNELRYGENPHQNGIFYGNLDEMFEQLHGKAISYNNLLDIDAATLLISEFEETTFAILKHNNACGIASRENLLDAWDDALQGDPVSAFGGVLIANHIIDEKTAVGINKLFFEIIIAPDYEKKALEILKQKKNRIILQQKVFKLPQNQFRTVINGVIEQSRDSKAESIADMKPVTKVTPSEKELGDLIFANKVVKHTKSNAIVLVKNRQLLGSGTGQTSRVDALKQAIAKAGEFGFDLNGAVMASDAFFPFADCVEIAYATGIKAVVQPGGSVRDQESIDFCNKHEMAMVFTGTRHFKH